MIRVAFFLTKSQVNFLKQYSEISVSEHIRRAIDQYIDIKKRTDLRVTISSSEFVKSTNERK